jgi:hypothetical protein
VAISSNTKIRFLIILISSLGFISACSENNLIPPEGSTYINTPMYELSFAQQSLDSCVMQKHEGECIALNEATKAYINNLMVPSYIQLVHTVQL